MPKYLLESAYEPTAIVAIEQYFDDRIIVDSTAHGMLPLSLRLFVKCMKPGFMINRLIRKAEARFPGAWGGTLYRKRYIDDVLRKHAGLFDAVVNIGAGLETRAFRLKELSKIPVWEVDVADTIDYREKRLRAIFGGLPECQHLVKVDLNHDGIEDALMENGYDRENTVFFVIEAVTQYLTSKGIDSLFHFLGTAKSGSYLVFSYIPESILRGEIMGVTKNPHWVFGKNKEEWSGFLQKYGYHLLEYADLERVQKECMKSADRNMSCFAVEGLILAQKN